MEGKPNGGAEHRRGRRVVVPAAAVSACAMTRRVHARLECSFVVRKALIRWRMATWARQQPHSTSPLWAGWGRAAGVGEAGGGSAKSHLTDPRRLEARNVSGSTVDGIPVVGCGGGRGRGAWVGWCGLGGFGYY